MSNSNSTPACPSGIFKCTITYTSTNGPMTLQGLMNGYESSPSAGMSDPPLVATTIWGSTTDPQPVLAYQTAGGYMLMSDPQDPYNPEFWSFEGYSIRFAYNMPDTSIMTITASVNSIGEISGVPVNPFSAGSLYCMTNMQTGGSLDDALTLSFTVGLADS